MLTVLLLGVIHDYQFDMEGTRNRLRPEQLEALQSQRNLYSAWVRGCVKDFGPDLIFDEMNLPEGATDDRLKDTGVLWVYMDIPEDVRKRFNLSCARPAGAEWVDAIDEPREQHWQLVIESISTTCKVKRIVAICGLAHLDTFSTRLRAAGHGVEIKNVRNELWNDEGWAMPNQQ